MNNRKLQALRALAARPGTPAEGVLARELLARLEKHEEPPDTIWKIWDDFEDGKITKERMLERLVASIRQSRNAPLPTTWKCPCGWILPLGGRCGNRDGHEDIQRMTRAHFKKGDRVFYNYWCYPENCLAVVTGYPDASENGTHPWAWIKVRFLHFKRPTYRQVPVWSTKGCHLSREPLPPDEAQRLSRP